MFSSDDDLERVGRRFAAAGAGGELDLPLPGSGRTLHRFAALAALAGEDPVLGRLGEGHADAVAILTELTATPPPPGDLWGVWAAARDSLRATPGPGGWRIEGERAWCSGARVCTRALVTAATDAGIRLFALDTTAAGVIAVVGSWPAVGMAASDTLTVRFTAVVGEPVGAPGAYTDRPGFWHGSIGVAACWYGAAAGVARLLLDRARHGKTAGDPHAMAHLGAIDATLSAAGDALRAAAAAIDADPGADRRWEAMRVRAAVERAATEVLDRVGRATGAGPLGHDRAHARRVADLTVYLRQSHAERDLADLGHALAANLGPHESWSLMPR